MAKMFYTLEETAKTLGMSEDDVMTLVNEDRLQQYKDRNKLMFKTDEVDALVGGPGDAPDAGSSGTGIGLSDSSVPLSEASLGDESSVGGLSLMDESGDTAIDLSDSGDDTSIGAALDDPSGSGSASGSNPGGLGGSDIREASGVSVFDSAESDAIDPMDQTAVSSHGMSEEDLSLESVGSGSGLLDLTRESDDTSLGAELLDEIYPGGGSETGGDFAMDSAVGSSGVFDNSLSLGATGTGSGVADPLTATGSAAASGSLGAGMTGLGDSAGGSALYGPPPGAATAAAAAAPVRPADHDPIGSGLSAGLLFGSLVALVAGLMVTLASLMGYRSIITATLIDGNDNSTWMLTAGLVVLVAVAAVIGVALARSGQR